MCGRAVGALVAVAVAATVGLAVASGSPSRALDDRRWTWSDRENGNRLAFRRDVAARGPLTLENLFFEVGFKCESNMGLSVDRVAAVDVAPSGTFSYSGAVADDNPYEPKKGTLTVSGRVAAREIRGMLRLTGVSMLYPDNPCRFDSGRRSFVARCTANCPPPPRTNYLTTLVVPYRSIAGIALGMTRRQARRVLGRCDGYTCGFLKTGPDNILAEASGLAIGYWRDDGSVMRVDFRRRRVVEVYARGGDLKLASGVGMGSPITAMRAAFPPKTVRCNVGRYRGCYAQRIVRRTVFLTAFQTHSRGPVDEITVIRCSPRSRWWKDAGNPCSRNFLSRQRK